jgi:two-component system response regulator AtoC
LELSITPLRDRPDDIPPLVAHFAKLHCDRNGVQKVLQADTIPRLQAHSWPGNVRELEHVIERLVVCTSGASISAVDVCAVLKAGPIAHDLSALDEKHETEKKTIIKQALAGSKSKGEAAGRLGISSSNLTYYIKLYGLNF